MEYTSCIDSEERRKYGGAVAGSSWLSGSRHQRSLGHGLSPSTPITAVPGNTPSDSDSLQNASGVGDRSSREVR